MLYLNRKANSASASTSAARSPTSCCSTTTGSRLLTGGGYLLNVPAIDLAEVGAGGGSIVHIDTGGSMQVGPRSAGARPGPVCYGLGGEAPTVTDTSVVLGHLNPSFLCGGELPIDAGASRRALAEPIARPLGLAPERAAWGARQVAIANMIHAIRAVSSERGRDPRDYALFAFGGNGALFATGMAEELGMRTIVVPPNPGKAILTHLAEPNTGCIDDPRAPPLCAPGTQLPASPSPTPPAPALRHRPVAPRFLRRSTHPVFATCFHDCRLQIAAFRPRTVCSRTDIEPDNDHTDTPATMSIDGLFFLSVEGVTAAVKIVEGLAVLGISTSKRGGYPPPRPKLYMGEFSRYGAARGTTATEC